jgi:hypothetical protein
MEHRWGQRVPVDMDVRLVARPSAIGAGRLRDISVSGAFVQTRLTVPLLARIHVEVTLNLRHGAETHDIPAYVVRSGADGVGIEWCELAPDAVVHILSGILEREVLQTSQPLHSPTRREGAHAR